MGQTLNIHAQSQWIDFEKTKVNVDLERNLQWDIIKNLPDPLGLFAPQPPRIGWWPSCAAMPPYHDPTLLVEVEAALYVDHPLNYYCIKKKETWV